MIENTNIPVIFDMSADTILRERARIREKALHDEASALEGAREEGMQKGIQEGMQKGIQKGMQEGMQKGIQEGLMQALEKLIASGMSEGDAKRLLGVD